MSDKILEALGAKDEHEALRMIAEANQFLTDVKDCTGRETFAASLGVIKSNASLASEIGKLTDKPVAESLGVILAWKSSHEELPKLQEENTKLTEKNRVNEVAGLIAQGKADGKLTPAMAKHFESKSADELRGFLAVAARVIPGDDKSQAKETTGGSDAQTNEAGRVCDAQGRTYEQIPPAQRSDLKRSDKALFEALHSDWVKAGKPAGALAK